MKTKLLSVLILLTGLQQALAATTITSVVPVNGASGVSPSAPVVFHFSAAMDPTVTDAGFIDVTGQGSSVPVISAWSAGNTVLTCTPSPQFANSHAIDWQVSGQDGIGNFLTGVTSGSFTNVAGVNGGSGTNLNTTFVIGEYSIFNQTSVAPPVQLAFEFFPEVILASNRTASNISLTLPAPTLTNLVESGLQPEKFDLNVYRPSAASLNSNYPPGNYTFDINPASLNQQVTVTLPALAYPNAPQIINYTAAQAINPAQPFNLTWNTFTNGGSADWVYMVITLSPATTFETPQFGYSGALTGAATGFTIPAGTLQPNTNYNAFLAFYHGTATTNSGLVKYAYFGAATEFVVSTGSNSAAPLLTINRSGSNAVLAWPTNAPGFTLEFATNLASPSWSSNLPAPVTVSTNYVVSNGISGPRRFFRLSNPP